MLLIVLQKKKIEEKVSSLFYFFFSEKRSDQALQDLSEYTHVLGMGCQRLMDAQSTGIKKICFAFLWYLKYLKSYTSEFTTCSRSRGMSERSFEC